MGIGILKVDLAVLPGVVMAMPAACTIVGSAECDTGIALKVSADRIPDGAELRMDMRYHGLSSSACVVIVE
ncbi:hypothetical protein [Sphingomonas sp. HMP6]|uniref:hypothetical protein n=1 Tax=Sphingomonas sp. HMP6 TaxID=1517551 RepID=UPI001596EAC0|nr:hypothetical protein [Sphingomonas sp. HMP6]BCA57709.1 hypothetical protein HMP06_0478 [Sphingomonas sp. HMP6]